MKKIIVGLFLNLAAWVVMAFSLMPAGLAAEQSSLRIVPLPDRQIRVTVTSPAPQIHRIDASSNLTVWRPLVLLTNSSGVTAFDDTNALATPARFFRAERVAASTGVAALGQPRGSAGGELEIFGQFFDGHPGDNVVRIGGAVARVLEASPLRLRVEIPTNAVTGPLTVTTPSGETTVRQSFVVTGLAPGVFNPPPGVSRWHYELVNAYGKAVPMAGGEPTNHFLVRRGRPIVNMAVPTNRTDQTYFLAVTISDAAPFVIDAASTAHALVFMHPLLQTRDPEMAGALLDLIAAEAKVQSLSSNIAAMYPLGGDPFANVAFVEAYTDAVASVINSSGARALGASRAKAVSEAAPGDVDLDFIVLERRGGDIFVKGRALNPVDWGLTLWKVNTRAAFPKGERDYRRALLFDKGVTNYPVESPIIQRFDIEADLAFERFDVIAAAIDELQDLVAPEEGEPLKLDDDDSIYLLRAIGPAWSPAPEYDFVQEQFQNEYVRIVAINLLNAVLDLLSVLIDEEELGGELAVGLSNTAMREAAHIQSTEDFLAAVAAIANEVTRKLAEKGVEKVAGKALMEKIAGTVGGVFLKVLEVISAPGQIVERITGLLRTSTMESAFIMTGNPFRLEVLSITPPGGAVGEPLEIVIRGAQFDTHDPKDFVTFSADQFYGRILSTETLTDNRQKITVEIPDALRTNDDGALPLFVFAQGRRGSTNFNLVRVPVVTRMEPTNGFASTASYLGVPFPGTPVRLTGYGFGPTNTFLFGGVEATDKSGTFGDVTVLVPAGASSGPITVRRVGRDGQLREGRSDHFEVLGAPEITFSAPSAGYLGSGVRVTARSVESGPASLQFNGAPLPVFVVAGGQLASVIPFGAPVGAGSLRVVTPAGTSAPASLTILEGPAPGGYVQVGGPFDDKSPPVTSPISLARAAVLVGTTNLILGAPQCSSGEFCVDDRDYVYDESGNVIETLDPPLGAAYEEGDFMSDNGTNLPPRFPIGAAYADEVHILGTVTGSAIITGSHDLIFSATSSNAIVNGPLTVTGSHNRVLNLTIHGRLTISGDNNEVNVIVGGASGPGVVITGHHNRVTVLTTNNSGDGLVIDGGSFNEISAFSAAFGNGGNGFTVTGGAIGNTLAVGTTLPGIPPGSGNAGHGVAVLDASLTRIIGTGMGLGANGGDGIHLEGNVSVTEMVTAVADSNAGHGIYVGPGVKDTLIRPAVTVRNGQHGIYLNGCSGSVLDAVQTGFNTGCGLLVSGVNDPTTMIGVSARSNAVSGLRLVNGTSRIAVKADNTFGPTGLELDGTNVTHNVITMEIDGCTGDGARLLAAENNELTLAIGNCGGHGLLLSGGGLNSVSLTASNNTLDGARFTDGTRDNSLAATVLSNRTGVVLASGANGNRIQGLRANANREHGLWLTGTGTSNNRVLEAQVGLPILTDPTNEPPGNAFDGIRIDAGASDNSLGSDSGHGPEVRNNGAAGIRIAAATNNVILGALVTLGDPSRVQPAGIIVEDGAVDTIIGGFTAAERCTNSSNFVGIHLRNGATRTVVQNCRVEANGGTGLLIEHAPFNLVGSTHGGITNQFLNNFASGVELAGAATTNCHVFGAVMSANNNGILVRGGAKDNRIGADNDIHGNATGVRVDGAARTLILHNAIHANSGSGIVFTGGATDNSVAACDVRGNAIGVVADGTATKRNEVSGNVITGNTGKGISLLGGANQGIEAPLISSLTSQSVMGESSTSDGSRIEVFSDLDDEGETSFGSGIVHNRRFSATLNRPLKASAVGVQFNLHATVTDANHNTSEFGDYLPGDHADGGAKMAFASTRDGNREIYLTDGSSEPPTRLTTDAADDHSPALSSDGTLLAFVSTRTGQPELFFLALSNTTVQIQLTTNAAPDYDPAWSPGGSNLFFVSERDGNAEIYRMNADGTAVTRLTFDAGIDRWPGVSPDGTKIVFASTRNGNFDLFVMDVSGGRVTPLVAHPAADTRPAWSPDGELIAFVSDRDGNLELYTVKSDGSQFTRLTAHAGADSEPSWSPNGQTLVFSSNRDEGLELHILPRAGGPTERLTVSTGDNTQPSVAKP